MAVHGYTLARAGRRAEALTTLDDIRRLTTPQSPPPSKSPWFMSGSRTGIAHSSGSRWPSKREPGKCLCSRPIPPSTGFARIPDSRNCSHDFVCLSNVPPPGCDVVCDCISSGSDPADRQDCPRQRPRVRRRHGKAAARRIRQRDRQPCRRESDSGPLGRPPMRTVGGSSRISRQAATTSPSRRTAI